MQRVVPADHLGDDLLEQAHDRVRVGHAALLDAGAQRIADVLRRVHANVRHDEQFGHNQGFLQLLEQLLVDFREGVQHRMDLAADVFAGLFEPRLDFVKKAHAGTSFQKLLIRGARAYFSPSFSSTSCARRDKSFEMP